MAELIFNEKLYDSLDEKSKAGYKALYQKAAAIVKKNPELTNEFNELLPGAVKNAEEIGTRLKELKSATPPLHPKYIQSEINKIGFAFEDSFSRKSDEHARAIKLLHKEVSPSLTRGITKNFYDKEDGGIQWGGIAGALGGVALASVATSGMNGFIPVLIMILGALAGSWIGNKAGDAVGNVINPKKPELPAQGKTQSVQLNGPTPEQQRAQAAAAAAAQPIEVGTPEDVDIIQSGQLPPGVQSSPTGPTQKERK